jgi:cell division septation protein DedD
MQKVVKDNIIYVEKPKVSLVPLALSAASLLFIVLGAASLFYLQKPLQEVQQTQSDASVSNGQVILTSDLSSTSTYTQGVPSIIDLKFNSQGVQLSGIQIVAKVQSNSELPTIEVPTSGDLQAIFQEVEQVSDGFLVSVIVTHRTLGQNFSSSSPTTFARLTVPLRAAGAIQVGYDRANSFATVANTSPPRDELRTPVDATFTIGMVSPTPSPSPSVSPSASPVITPAVTPSPSASPRVTPTPSPTVRPSTSPTPTPVPTLNPTPSPTPAPTTIPAGDDFFPVNNNLFATFMTNDAARTVVPAAELRPYQTYRVRFQSDIQNRLKSSTTNTTGVVSAMVVNGQGYVTNSVPYSLIANHADGAGNTMETVFSTLPNNTIRVTVDSPSRYTETNEGNNILTYTFSAGAGTGGTTNQGTCNQYCADSRECNAGFTCFYNRCRRPDNPDSSTCSAPSQTVTTAINKSCNVGCTSNKECAINLRCYQGACRLATNPSSFTCSAATAGVITKGSQGTKGEQLASPTATPTSSPKPGASASVSPRPSGSPATSASLTASSSPSVTDRNTEDGSGKTLFGDIIANLQARGISLPIVAVGIGILLFILALIFAVLSRVNNEPPKVVNVRKTPPKTPAEDELQKKINALKSATPPAVPVAYGKPPQVAQPPVAAQQVTVVKPSVPAAPQGPASTMMSRLKDRGVLDNKPKS